LDELNMLLPRYSIRTLFYIMVGVSLFALLITFAMRGSMWSLGIAAAIGSLFFVAFMHAGMFLVTGVLADIASRRKLPAQIEEPQAPRSPLPEAPH
jgi:hypothetical protein